MIVFMGKTFCFLFLLRSVTVYIYKCLLSVIIVKGLTT